MTDKQLLTHTPGGTPVYTCSCGMAWFPVIQELAIARGIVKKSIDIAQGGYRGGATSASAGTHDGGGAFDFVQYSDDLVTLVRQMGGAGWHRTTAQGFSGPHLHIELVGCPHHPSADYQVEAYKDGYNGLGNGWKGRDDGPRVSPIRTWSQGIAWAKTQLNELELTVSQYTDIMKKLDAIHDQTHYDAGVTQRSISTVRADIKAIPSKTVSALLAVKWGVKENTLGALLTRLSVFLTKQGQGWAK